MMRRVHLSDDDLALLEQAIAGSVRDGLGILNNEVMSAASFGTASSGSGRSGFEPPMPRA
jgi:hypothetical protein